MALLDAFGIEYEGSIQLECCKRVGPFSPVVFQKVEHTATAKGRRQFAGLPVTHLQDPVGPT